MKVFAFELVEMFWVLVLFLFKVETIFSQNCFSSRRSRKLFSCLLSGTLTYSCNFVCCQKRCFYWSLLLLVVVGHPQKKTRLGVPDGKIHQNIYFTLCVMEIIKDCIVRYIMYIFIFLMLLKGLLLCIINYYRESFRKRR